MRGKKKDTEFLGKFITECVELNKISTDEIVTEAKSRVVQIDRQIEEIEKQKQIRSKLLDVISAFEQPIKNSSSEEIRLLSFFKIQHPAICKGVCDRLKEKNCSAERICNSFMPRQDAIFSIKQLLEMKIITKTGDCLMRGENFDEYYKFVLREIS